MPWIGKDGKLWSPIALKKPEDIPQRKPGTLTTGVTTVTYTRGAAVESSYEAYKTRKQKKKEEKARKRAERLGYIDTPRTTQRSVMQNTGHFNDGILDDDEYVYKPPVKKEFEWTPTRWSSFNWISYAIDEDDNSALFVKEPENYLTPTAEEIRVKINVHSSDTINLVKELCRVCYFKMIDDKNYIARKHQQSEGTTWYENKRKIFDNVYQTYIPGFSPLEQAIAVYYKIRDEKARMAKDSSKDRRESSGHFSFKREDYADATITNQFDHNTYSKRHFNEIMNNISIMGDMGSQFKVERETGEKEVASSMHIKKQVMRNYDQLSKLDIYQRVLPYYGLKLLTKELVVSIPVSKSEKKQVIIIILDYSGSMNEDAKQKWVNAILIDRFRYVMKGEAEIYFSYFISNPAYLKFRHIKDASDVKAFWKCFDNNPNGFMTDMHRIVKDISEKVASGSFYNLKCDLSKERPEILIINDGQDHIGYSSFPYKVNAISLLQFSTELKNLCVNSGGKQVRVESTGAITAFSNEGEVLVSKA